MINKLLVLISFVFLLGSSIYFTYNLRFPQFRFLTLFKGLKKDKEATISPIKSIMLSLAARIGVGSIAGVAISIYLGGPGTIFWIWIGGVLCSVLTYCESYLGQKYQKKRNNEYLGGPIYYIKNKKASLVYAIVLILVYILGFIPIQANTIVKAITNYFNINSYIVIVLLLIITVIPIIKGLNKIIDITSKMVPIIGVLYIMLSFLVIINNIRLIPKIIVIILENAFNVRSFFTGFIIGIERGIFITESGLGTSSISSSSTFTTNKKNLSLSQILGIYFTIFIVCTSTALLILTSNYQDIIINTTNGIELTQYAYIYHLGNIGSTVLLISIFLLAYSTILVGYFYSDRALVQIGVNKNKFLKLVTAIIVLIGSIINATIIWEIADILVQILIIINVYFLFKYRKEIVIDYKK